MNSPSKRSFKKKPPSETSDCNLHSVSRLSRFVVWNQVLGGPVLTVCSWLCVFTCNKIELILSLRGFSLCDWHTELKKDSSRKFRFWTRIQSQAVQVLDLRPAQGLLQSNSHSSTVWWFCRFPGPLKRWCFLLDGRQWRSPRLHRDTKTRTSTTDASMSSSITDETRGQIQKPGGEGSD